MCLSFVGLPALTEITRASNIAEYWNEERRMESDECSTERQFVLLVLLKSDVCFSYDTFEYPVLNYSSSITTT